ncbi:NNP family nitrate/nitrite transporter-like MFS transporter [Modestobacter roseus]|uniref:NNP family nitrate/nitrite transporter-like MFS transporter n=2 Tax=Modestobacter roseus TaxID=1181884 RepID=A0A562IPF1_9ACTN|nr:MFS transporter [Modestobacter roseus]TWH72605.1 NNP family nitrate/nitrite transporter-like MFS transporter [Modestobacter roseus]
MTDTQLDRAGVAVAPTPAPPAGNGPVARVGGRWIDHYDPEDPAFWASPQGKPVARRNLVWSVFAENIGFSVWQLFSVSTAVLASIGYGFTSNQLFWLVATAGLVGAIMRVPYTFMPALFGGRNWTVVSAALLLLPVTLLVVAATTDQPYWFWVLTAITCGFGGGNFASSMANISFFYPDKEKGFALGLNAAGGNIGVAIIQLVGPLAAGAGALAVVGGVTGTTEDGADRYVQNVALIWVPFILLAMAGAWFGMHNLSGAKANIGAQAAITRRKQTWIMSFLYIGAFGSFIGFSGAFPLVLANEFAANTYQYAFLGPLVGSLTRPLGGLLADRVGGARVTVVTFVGQALAIGVAIAFVNAGSFAGFLLSFLVLFGIVGMTNGSTYRMIPIIYRAEAAAASTGETPAQTMYRARRDTAAAVGIISAVGALGAVFIPRIISESYSATGGVGTALGAFCAFYVACVAVTWFVYLRRGTLMQQAGV